jgi:hypothetical protein
VAAEGFALNPGLPPANWLFTIVILGPYVLIFAAARRAGAGGRGRGLIRTCGPVVIVLGFLLLVVAAGDAQDHVRWVRPPELPGILFAGGPVFFVRWTAGGLALLIARPSR